MSLNIPSLPQFFDLNSNSFLKELREGWNARSGKVGGDKWKTLERRCATLRGHCPMFVGSYLDRVGHCWVHISPLHGRIDYIRIWDLHRCQEAMRR
jgi:hypothetical protein